MTNYERLSGSLVCTDITELLVLIWPLHAALVGVYARLFVQDALDLAVLQWDWALEY